MNLSFRCIPEQWLGDGQFERLCGLLLGHPAAVDEVSLFTVELGSGTYDPPTIARHAETMRTRMAQLRARGARRAGINVLVTLGHWDAPGGYFPVPPFPRTVGHDGQVSFACPCPNSVEFRALIATKYRLYAAADPDFIWVDDDLRTRAHGVPYPCFCPICLDKFGHGDDRAALVAELNDPNGREARLAWFEFNVSTLESLCTDIRRAIREVDPAVEIGLMSCGYSHALGRWTTALGAVRGRPGGGYYVDDVPRSLLSKALEAGRQAREYAPAVADMQYELENFPYLALGKSVRTVLNECTVSLIMGCNGIAFNALKDSEGTLEDYEPLVAAIAAERPAWERLVEGAAGLPQVGFWPADDDALRAKREVDANGWFWEGSQYNVNQPDQVMEIGVPLTTDPRSACGTLLAGKVAEAFTADELRRLLSGGVLLDAAALEVLWARGLGELAGVRLGERHPITVREKFTSHAFNGRFAGDGRDVLALLIEQAPEVWSLAPVAGGVGDLAHLVRYDGVDAGCCLSTYTNHLGGRVAVGTYSPWRRLGRAAKRHQLLTLADWLAGGKLPVRIEENVRVAPFVRLSADGRRAAVVLLNTAFDPSGPLTVRLRADCRTACQVTAAGERAVAVSPGPAAGQITIAVPSLDPWRTAIVLAT